jgi:uncharacterized protein
MTEHMQRVVTEQRLGFYATVSADGSPNLSPKGSTYVLDDKHLMFGDIRSPQTVANIRRGSLVEVREARPLVSPAYDDGSLTEDEVAQMWRARYAESG